jgi:hypothetical protein
MILFLFLGLWGKVLWPEGHRLETFWELGVASSHSYILKEILKFFGERDTSETCSKALRLLLIQ